MDEVAMARFPTKSWNRFYPPLPDDIINRRKMVWLDLLYRILFIWPVAALSIFGSKVQFKYQRAMFKMSLGSQSKRLGDDEHMKTSETEFDGVPVRVYEPKERTGDGAIIYFHGGGYTFCTARQYDFVTRIIAERSGLVLVSVDYRLAPEHKYPAAVLDGEKAAIYFLTTAHKDYGVDPKRVVIMGDSAGGNLTAVVVQKLRKLVHVPQPKLQVLIYPWMQMVDFQLPSYRMMDKYKGTCLLHGESMVRFTLHYLLGSDNDHFVADLYADRHIDTALRQSPSLDHLRADRLSNQVLPPPSQSPNDQSQSESINQELCNLLKPYMLDPDVSPLLHPDLEHLPKCMVISVEFDPLRDEALLYARRLKDAGVPVVHKHYERGFHGMLCYKVDATRKMVNEICGFLKESL